MLLNIATITTVSNGHFSATNVSGLTDQPIMQEYLELHCKLGWKNKMHTCQTILPVYKDALIKLKIMTFHNCSFKIVTDEVK